jgi:hypothetical protein
MNDWIFYYYYYYYYHYYYDHYYHYYYYHYRRCRLEGLGCLACFHSDLFMKP